eukprot:PhM_4_TR19102/c0_g1_i2/m.28058
MSDPFMIRLRAEEDHARARIHDVKAMMSLGNNSASSSSSSSLTVLYDQLVDNLTQQRDHVVEGGDVHVDGGDEKQRLIAALRTMAAKVRHTLDSLRLCLHRVMSTVQVQSTLSWSFQSEATMHLSRAVRSLLLGRQNTRLAVSSRTSYPGPALDDDEDDGGDEADKYTRVLISQLTHAVRGLQEFHSVEAIEDEPWAGRNVRLSNLVSALHDVRQVHDRAFYSLVSQREKKKSAASAPAQQRDQGCQHGEAVVDVAQQRQTRRLHDLETQVDRLASELLARSHVSETSHPQRPPYHFTAADRVAYVSAAMHLHAVSPYDEEVLAQQLRNVEATQQTLAALNMRHLVEDVRHSRHVDTLRQLYDPATVTRRLTSSTASLVRICNERRNVFCHHCGHGPFLVARTWCCDACFTKLHRPSTKVLAHNGDVNETVPSNERCGNELTPEEREALQHVRRCFDYFVSRIREKAEKRAEGIGAARRRLLLVREVAYSRLVDMLTSALASLPQSTTTTVTFRSGGDAADPTILVQATAFPHRTGQQRKKQERRVRNNHKNDISNNNNNTKYVPARRRPGGVGCGMPSSSVGKDMSPDARRAKGAASSMGFHTEPVALLPPLVGVSNNRSSSSSNNDSGPVFRKAKGMLANTLPRL